MLLSVDLLPWTTPQFFALGFYFQVGSLLPRTCKASGLPLEAMQSTEHISIAVFKGNFHLTISIQCACLAEQKEKDNIFLPAALLNFTLDSALFNSVPPLYFVFASVYVLRLTSAAMLLRLVNST